MAGVGFGGLKLLVIGGTKPRQLHALVEVFLQLCHVSKQIESRVIAGNDLLGGMGSTQAGRRKTI